MKKFIPIILLLFCSCKAVLYQRPDPPAYIATVSNVNCNAGKNDFRGSLFLGGNHAEAQTTFNLTDKHAVQFNTYQGFKNRFVLNELAYSRNFSVMDHIRINVAAGYGYGTLKYYHDRSYYTSASSYASFYEKKYDMRSFMHRFYIQPAHVFEKNNGLKIMMSARLSGIYFPVYYYNLTETKRLGSTTEVLRADSIDQKNKFSWMLDPALAIIKQGDNLGLFMQCQFSVPLRKTDLWNQHHLMQTYYWPLLSLGLTINIDGMFWEE